MGTKTISLKREAYERLKTARRYPEECRRGRLPERVLDRIDAIKRGDSPAANKWASR